MNLAAATRLVNPYEIDDMAGLDQVEFPCRWMEYVEIAVCLDRRYAAKSLYGLKQSFGLCAGVIAGMLVTDLFQRLYAQAGGYFFVHSLPLNRFARGSDTRFNEI